jgi:hypothetical protein
MANIDHADADFKKLAEKLEKKIHSYLHWPDSRKLGDKLLPFTESEAFVFFLADILKNNRWDTHPEFCNNVGNNEYAGYCVFIHIFIQYVIHQKERYRDILSVLEYTTDKAVEVVMKDDECDYKYYMLRWIFNLYKKEKYFPVELLKKFDVVPDDKLFFIPIDGDSAYEVKAYSGFTCGEIKIPPTHNGKPVKKIAYGGFPYSGITGVEIPEGIEAIESFAFAKTKLKKVLFPRSLKSIGKYAFSCCGKLKGDIIIPKNIETMEENVFTFTELSNILVEGYSGKPDTWDDHWHVESHIPRNHQTFHNVVWGYFQPADKKDYENKSVDEIIADLQAKGWDAAKIQEWLDENIILDEWRKAAGSGSLAAQMEMGKWYAEGKKVKQDFVEALKWYLLAAEQENWQAQLQVSAFYKAGLGVEQDMEKAIEWGNKALESFDKQYPDDDSDEHDGEEGSDNNEEYEPDEADKLIEKIQNCTGLAELPDGLLSLITFQCEESSAENYANGFSASAIDSDTLKCWSKSEDEEFLNSIFPFAYANGSGSFYAMWDTPVAEWPDLPIVVFGDEGGAHVVAENIYNLVSLLTYDVEISVDFDNVYFYKDEDYEESPDHEKFLEWLKENYDCGTITEANEAEKIIKIAQEKYKAAFDKWMKKHIKE